VIVYVEHGETHLAAIDAEQMPSIVATRNSPTSRRR
jgi:hypothetical protein